MGPDKIHPKILRSLALINYQFVEAVTDLFNTCASTGKIPAVWKEAIVISLHKKGSKKCPLNYRPVSLTCIICKKYEKLVRAHILKHIEDKIHPCQHGFVNKKSCLSNFLESVETILDMVHNGFPVHLFYMDFSKAFDSVPHFRLLTKLENMGITGKTLEIIRDFLSGRKMRTSVNGFMSTVRLVISGVPQGSVLGPLLFVIFINDLPNCLKNISKLFADDLKIIANAQAPDIVREDLQALEKWESIWLLKFHQSKCKVMHSDFNDNPSNSYQFNGVTLSAIDNDKELEKNLGIIITDKSLSWNLQIKSSISKATQMIAWVTRNMISREKNVMLHVYKTVIRHHVEYCVQVWAPVAKHGNWGIIMDIESVQRRFTRLINGNGTLPYRERLERLG